MAAFAPQKVDLPEMTEGDHLDWPGMSATQDGGNPAQAITKFRVSFRKKDGTLGCTLSTDGSESGAVDLTLSSGASWTVDAVKVPASSHNLTSGVWLFDLEVTLADGAILTVGFGALKVRPQQTRAPA